MRAEVLVRKEEAVEAVATMNLLQRVVEQQDCAVAEHELATINAAKVGDRELALRSFQESRVYQENLEMTRPLLKQARRESR